MGYASYFDDSGAGGLDFVDKFGGAELVFCEGFDVGYWFAACALCDVRRWLLLKEFG